VSHATHPARSLDFLSRLHDGELSAAERAHFESHRAHCAECRKAAAQFEEALAYYRTAGTTPPPSDLAARILRRLEASNPRRSPFGVFFGIDVRWAGAFTAALIAVILGYALVEREAEPRKIRVSFTTPVPAASAPDAAARPTLLPPLEVERPEKRPPSKAATAAKRDSEPAPAAPPALAAREGLAAKEGKVAARVAEANRPEPAPTALSALGEAASAREESLPGGAGAQDQAAAPARAQGLLSVTPAPIRITVTALDSEGAPPALLNEKEITLSTDDAGQYVLLVGADGVPIRADRSDARRKESAASAAKSTSETLGKLRFAVGSRPRRLLLRLEQATR
jgi:hypothetical protein